MNNKKEYTADELLNMFKSSNLLANLSEKERNMLEEYKKKLRAIQSKEDPKKMISNVYPKIISSKIHELVKGVSYAIGCLELDSRQFSMLYNPSYSPETVEIVEVDYNKFKDEIDPQSIRSLTFGEDGTEDETEVWVILAYYFSDNKFLEINSIVYIDEISNDLKTIRPTMDKNKTMPLLRPKIGNKYAYKIHKEFLNEVVKKAKRNK